MTRSLIRIGVDTGGTFTDLIALDRESVRVAKVLSTPANPARAVFAGLAQLVPEGTPVALTYSTTVATNALLERRGARVLLFTTAGFEDVLEIGRQARPDLYALEPRKPASLVGGNDRIGVSERTAYDGGILEALTPQRIDSAVRLARRRKPAAIAVCFLHSHVNHRHERRLAAALRAAGFDCTASHELGARPREYERFSTAVLNAYVSPKMKRHVGELAHRLRSGVFRVMQSSGGAMDAGTAAREAARTILSGPAAGVVGAQAMAQEAGFSRIVTFDMGGTSTDVCLVDGVIRRHAECVVVGLPINVPAIDVHTVGAGGGSLAFRDPGGALKVGPQSAGADPGPACYGRGEEATVTDANLLLGRLGRGVLAGTLELDRAAAERAVGKLARSLRLPLERTALGIVRVANAAMERAIRAVSVERGHDPRDYVLVAFGGAAPLHACELADGLGIARVLVPRFPGVLSAWGAAGARITREYVRTVQAVAPPPALLRGVDAELARRARRDMHAEQIAENQLRLEPYLGLRYAGQSFEVEVPLTARYLVHFHAEHERLYGYSDRAREVEVVYIGLRASAPQRGGGDSARRASAAQSSATVGRERARVCTSSGWMRARVLWREALRRGSIWRGPVVVQELSATTYVAPGWMARVDRHGHLVITHAQ